MDKKVFTVGAGLGRSVGKVTGAAVGGIVNQVEKTKKHKGSKLVVKLLDGFDPEDEKWISCLLEGFSEIFIW